MCNVCYGQTGCPVCQEEKGIMVICERCNGEGILTFFDAEGKVINREQYMALPVQKREAEYCPTCEGEGWTIYIYEPSD